MISFIVIGKNVESTLKLCIDSILQFIDKNGIKNWEIIYSDSGSSDKSIEIAGQYPVQIVQLEGELNAAIGRNEGAKAASGEILFFIDGDMEIISESLHTLFKNENELAYPYLTGNYTNIYYTHGYQNELKRESFMLRGDTHDFYYRKFTGGLFLVTKELWQKVNGMDERFDSNQDIDYGLRMTTIGYEQRFYKNVYLAIHHTVDYYEKKRFSFFIKSTRLLCPGLLIRKHLFKGYFLEYFLRSRYTLILFIATLLTLSVHSWMAVFLFSFYLLFQLVRTLRSEKLNSSVSIVFLYKILYDFYSLIGFLFYYPRQKEYTVTQNHQGYE